MPTANDIDIEIPSIFIKKVLTNPDPDWPWPEEDLDQVVAASSALVAEHGTRFYRDLNVPSNTSFPYVYWSGDTTASGIAKFSIPRSFVARKQSEFIVRTVRKFPVGRASHNPSRSAQKYLVQCLTGSTYTPVYDALNNFLGHVSAAEYMRDYQRSYQTPDTEETVTENGVVVRITFRDGA